MLLVHSCISCACLVLRWSLELFDMTMGVVGIIPSLVDDDGRFSASFFRFLLHIF